MSKDTIKESAALYTGKGKINWPLWKHFDSGELHDIFIYFKSKREFPILSLPILNSMMTESSIRTNGQMESFLSRFYRLIGASLFFLKKK